MNAPFVYTRIGFAALLLTNEKAAQRAAYMERLDSFHAIIEQLPENSALLPLLLLRRYPHH